MLLNRPFLWTLISIALAFSPDFAKGDAGVKFFFPSQLNGEIQPCYCKGNRKGGLAKLKTALTKVRKKDSDIVAIAPGCFLSYEPSREKDSTILALLPAYRYDAVAVGWAEMIEGSDFFFDHMNADKINWVNCNLLYRYKSLAPSYRIIKRGNTRIGVTSAVSRLWMQSPLLNGKIVNISILPPDQQLIKVVEAIKDSITHLVVVSQMEPTDREKFLKNYHASPELIVLQAWTTNERDNSARTGNRMIINSGDRGRTTTLISTNSKGAAKVDVMTLDSSFTEDPEIKALVGKVKDATVSMESVDLEAAIKKLKSTEKRNARDSFILYYSSACADCHMIIGKYLPSFMKRHPIKLSLIDVGVGANYQKLLEAQKRYNKVTREIPVALYQGIFYDGTDPIIKILEAM